METVQITDVSAVLSAFGRWIRQRSKLTMADYGWVPGVQHHRGEWREASKAFHADARQIAKDGVRARKALEDAVALPPDAGILAESFRAFSGRLSWDGKQLEYTTGQYWPTEYRKAAAAVLELYVAAVRAKRAEESPREFVYFDIEDVKRANAAVGHHWFDRDTIRFFKTRIVSPLIAGTYFVSAETGPSGRQMYTVRQALPNGHIDTVGEFQQYGSRGDALRAARRAAAERSKENAA